MANGVGDTNGTARSTFLMDKAASKYTEPNSPVMLRLKLHSCVGLWSGLTGGIHFELQVSEYKDDGNSDRPRISMLSLHSFSHQHDLIDRSLINEQPQICHQR